eukprot:CAMPEP_0116067886 /NCGR_PEP_ID=MMETSP0322-20121206/11333_1 /TAXON_ID=163516 /ORGANISM="Leptocylindrus danicus var. apora, Strain B651" /LENGTH=576 /DNA_ID=CAMNT_0003554893 /DNA_START=66 /DNA_END=1793 /DNA_ORIENTATION=+
MDESIHLTQAETRMDPFSKREGRTLRWQNVNFTLNDTSKGAEPKKLIDGMYGEVPKGNVTAIMGPSGSGKTSLLNILAGRSATRNKLIVEADVRLDQYKVNPTDKKARQLIAFVAQDDSLSEASTPREAIRFSAKLRLPRSTKEEEVNKLTERMLKELGLLDCADTFVGGPLLKGISGGERKRTSVGVELVVKPEIVFLDEPTSGLDSHSAVQLVNVLHKVSNAGSSVLLTIHQPSSEVFHTLDYIILLNKGRVMYTGSVDSVAEDFEKLGHPCPKNYNPADHIMTVAQTLEVKQLETDGFFTNQSNGSKGFEEEEDFSTLITDDNKNRVSNGTQVKLLFQRELRGLQRNTVPLIARFGITIFLNVVFGLIFFDIGASDNAEVNNLNSHFGSLVMVLVSAMFGTAQPALVEFPSERPVFLREYYTNHYTVGSYFLSKFSVEAIVTFAQCFTQSVLNYYMINLQMGFITFTLLVYVLGMASTAVAVLMGAFVSDPGIAQELLPLLFVPQLLFAGFFIASDLIPVYLQWAQYLCSLTYSMRIALIYEFGDCEPGEAEKNCDNLLDYTFAEELDVAVYW